MVTDSMLPLVLPMRGKTEFCVWRGGGGGFLCPKPSLSVLYSPLKKFNPGLSPDTQTSSARKSHL